MGHKHRRVALLLDTKGPEVRRYVEADTPTRTCTHENARAVYTHAHMMYTCRWPFVCVRARACVCGCVCRCALL